MKQLIVIEGLDGSGKATQAKMLYENLKKKYPNELVRQVSFPDYESDSSALVKMYLSGQFGENPDAVNAYAASSFYAVDRYASYMKNWKKDYEDGIIIADRYTTSNAIHQCSKLQRKEWDIYLEWLFKYEYEMLKIPAPNMVIFLKVDPVVSQKLMSERYHGDESRKDIHERDADYLKRSQEAAEYCSKKLGWQVIECCRDNQMRSVEEIDGKIMALISQIFCREV